jgi:hypothetical protein
MLMAFQVTTPCKKLQRDIKNKLVSKLVSLHSSESTLKIIINNVFSMYKDSKLVVLGKFFNINLSVIVQKIVLIFLRISIIFFIERSHLTLGIIVGFY